MAAPSPLRIRVSGDGGHSDGVDLATVISHSGNINLPTTSSQIAYLPYASTCTFDLSIFNWWQVTLAGNPTLVLANAATGQQFTLRLVQDGTGSRTVTWFTTLKWPSATPPTLTTTAGGIDVFTFKVITPGFIDGFTAGQAMG